MQYREFTAMSTGILLAAEGDPEALETGFDEVQDFIQAAEKRFTRFSEDSELSALNRSAGGWFPASPELFELLVEAGRLHQLTGGLFDPAVLNTLERLGYDRSIEQVRGGSASSIRLAGDNSLPGEGFAGVSLDEEGRRVRLPANMRIDLGGIAKGWIAEQAALRLARWSTACAVDAGGDMFLVGLPHDQPAWPVGLEDPQNAGLDLAQLTVPSGAVATSTTLKRRWQKDGVSRHHLIDPRTNLPAQSNWVSVTVLAPHAAEAEVFAKSLLIAGPREAAGLADANGSMAYLAVDRENRIFSSSRIREVLHV